MADSRFTLSWRLTLETDQASTLADTLAPETDGTHAEIRVEGSRLTVQGGGPPGACQHTLDDVLACLTAAVDALDASNAGE